jgi:hypothetical protein
MSLPRARAAWAAALERHGAMSWLPTPAVVPNQLELDAGAARATCAGDAVAQYNGESWGNLSSTQLHASGLYYGEFNVPEGDGTAVGIFAAPASEQELLYAVAFNDQNMSVAAVRSLGAGIISVAADLNAGVASFFANGALVAQVPLSLIPGVGGYALGASSFPGHVMGANYGSAPFAYAPPVGFAAWSSDADGGACDSDVATPARTANIQGAETTFLASVDHETDLVVLGTYASGGVGGWQWTEDGGTVDTGTFERGTVHVQLRRPGRVALVLSAYEATDWILDVGADTQLDVVMVRGMHVPTVTGVPSGVPINMSSICTDGDGGRCSGTTGDDFPIAPHSWPFDYGGGDTQAFIDYVEHELCLPLSVFGGAYDTQSFIVD